MKQNEDITTNAYNFGKLFSCGVDERTSIYNMSFNVAELYSSGGLNFVAKIGYNPLTKKNVGFGSGWSLNLSEYDIKNRILTLSDGASFRIVNIIGNRVSCRYLKENKDVKITANNGLLVVTHKDGTLEEFDSIGKLSKVKSPSGHWHKFSFRNDRLLSTIDSEGKRLVFNYTSNDFSILSSNGTIKCIGQISSNALKTVVFDSDNKVAILYKLINGFQYIKSVKHPTGFNEYIYYKNDAIKLPRGAGIAYLPGISEHKVTVDGKVSSTKYEHTANNYLGFGLPSYNKEYDTLYETKDEYNYGCTITTSEKIREVTYNKYHLPIKDVTYDAVTGLLLLEVLTEYYAVDGSDFNQQPNQFLKPKVKNSKYYSKNGDYREEIVITEFDTHENITRKVDKYGIEKVYTYYNFAELHVNEDHIPHLIKRIDCSPSLKYSTGKEYSYHIIYEYDKVKSIDNNNNYFLKKREIQTSNDGVLIKNNQFDYYLDNNDILTFGLLKNTVFTLSNKIYETVKYKFSPENISITKFAEYFDGLSAQQNECYCRHTHKIISTTDITGNTIHYSYDLLGRIVTEIHDKDTNSEFIIRHTYDINECSMTTYRDNYLFEKVVYDGKGRKKTTFRIDTNSKLRKNEEYEYDYSDRIIQLRRFDYINNNEKSYLINRAYDIWGKNTETAENGLKTITITDNYELSSTSYNEYQDVIFNKQKKYKNELGKVIKDEINGISCQYVYDGFGVLIKQIDFNGLEKDYIIDQHGLEVEQTIYSEDSTVIIASEYDNRFSCNGDQEITKLTVNGNLISSRNYDGLGRIKHESINGIDTIFRYNTLSKVPNEIESDGNIVFNEIDECMGLVIQDSSNKHKEINTFNYEKKTKLILEESNSSVINSYEYYPNRKIKKEVQHGRVMTYEYSSNGLLTRSIDYNGVEENREYDSHGHLAKIKTDTYNINFTRDILFRVKEEIIESKIDHIVVRSEYKYDDNFINKVASKTTTVNGTNDNYQIYNYNALGKLIKKIHIDNFGEKFIDSYKYNKIGQLIEVIYSENCRMEYYKCGFITKQNFVFDSLNNISIVNTSFVDFTGVTCIDTAEYLYDLFRLKTISHSFLNIKQEDFTHNKQGYVSLDNKGCKIEYDAHGRIVEIIDINGVVTSQYKYSPSGLLMKQTIVNQDDILFYYAAHKACGEHQGEFYSKTITMSNAKLGRCIYGVNTTDLNIFFRDYKNSITGIVNKTNSNDIQYSAYGNMSIN